MTALDGWENFYVVVGSSAGALIGLQFVVITLIAEMPFREGMQQAAEAFATPTVIHFGAVLLLAAIINTPWQTLTGAAIAWGVVGLSGAVYELVVMRRMRTQTAYRPGFEDWLFHFILPLAAYVVLAISALPAAMHGRSALFVVAASALLLLFVGIHNAWDAVTYNVYVLKNRRPRGEPSEPAPREQGERQRIPQVPKC